MPSENSTKGVGVRDEPGYSLRRVLSVLALATSIAATAAADFEKVHGFELDDRHGLRVREEDGWVTIALRLKERGRPGFEEFVDDDTNELVQIVRRLDEEPLARFRAEVLVPAPPNYVQNAGQRYRITLEGLTIAPGYAKIFEVDAYDTLGAVQAEMRMVWDQAFGVRRDALIWGTILALNVLNESRRVPALVPDTILRSKVGRFRIQGQDLGRGKVGSVERFQAVETGGGFQRVLDSRPSMTTADAYTALQGPSYKRGQQSSPPRSGPARAARFKAKAEFRQPKYRANMVDQFEDPPRPDRSLARPLSQPEYNLPAVQQQEWENAEARLGEPFKGAMQDRADRRDGLSGFDR